MKILGQEFTIVMSDPGGWNTGGMGRSDITKNSIVLNNKLQQDCLCSTLLHEVIHCILDMHGYEESNNEQLIGTLATGLWAVIVDNGGSKIFEAILDDNEGWRKGDTNVVL